MAANSQPIPAPPEEAFPRHSASEAPIRRWDRIAFQVWVVAVLLTLVITLSLYLYDKISLALHR
ncbi:MAG TPA: hypothetical protein VHR66_07690 [Gemmataceae bacterium]|jgi:hypothetical protein|nr:hypothetical protein [Gemmataceae bacterium]